MIVLILALRAVIAVSYLLLAIGSPDCAKDWAFAYALLVAVVAVGDLVRGRAREK